VIGTDAADAGPRRFMASSGVVPYLDTGDGPAVLLLHDSAASAATWIPFLPLFQGRFRVVAPDVHGRDDVRARSVRELLDHLGIDRYAVVGIGAGGSLAQALAVDDARVDAMVLLGADPLDDLRSQAVRDALGQITFPVLLLWGEDDDVSPADFGEAMNDAMPSSTLGLLPGCGHDLLAEAPETIGPMIAEYLRARFLREPHGHDQKDGVVLLQLERRPPWVGSSGEWAEDEADDWYAVDDEED
jgi:pimeloyl-ACP methyl ester carboxylesterase